MSTALFVPTADFIHCQKTVLEMVEQSLHQAAPQQILVVFVVLGDTAVDLRKNKKSAWSSSDASIFRKASLYLEYVIDSAYPKPVPSKSQE